MFFFVKFFFEAPVETRAPPARTGADNMLVASNGRRPDMKLKNSDYHLFLSHIWSTGQDACGVIKTQLLLLLPNVKIFLDVN